MKKIGLIFSVWLLTSFAMQAQAYTNLVGQKTPELIIEKWISPAVVKEFEENKEYPWCANRAIWVQKQ